MSVSLHESLKRAHYSGGSGCRNSDNEIAECLWSLIDVQVRYVDIDHLVHESLKRVSDFARNLRLCTKGNRMAITA